MPEAILTASLRDYRLPAGTDPIGRVDRSTASAPRTCCTAKSDAGQEIAGVNLASQDYLSLSLHPAIREAAIAAIQDCGVHTNAA